MDMVAEALTALWQVILAGLLLGAGIPALFSLGMKSLEFRRVPAPVAATNASADGTVAGAGGKAGAAVCFGLCVLAVLFGIIVIIFGKQLFG